MDNININQNTGQASMAYYGERPWHGLGTKVDKVMTAEEALTAAQLNFNVEKVAIKTFDNVTINGKFATRRDDVQGENSILGIVGKNYEIIQNKEILNILDPIVGRNEAIYHTAGALGNGSRIWLLAKLPDSIVINGKDKIDKYLLLFNSHDGTTPAIIKLVATRVVCENTLMFGLKEGGEQVRIKHFSTAGDKLTEAMKIMKISRDYFIDIEKTINRMSVTEITTPQLMEYINGILDIEDENVMSTRMENKRNKIVELCEVGTGQEMVSGTVWSALNGVTEYADHFLKSGNVNMSTFFGLSNNLKTVAWNKALELVN